MKGEIRMHKEAVVREAGRREEGEARVSQQLHNESAHRRAMEVHLETKLSLQQRELQAEVTRTTSRDQELSEALAQLREDLQTKINSHRQEIKQLHEECAITREKLACRPSEAGISGISRERNVQELQTEVRRQVEEHVQRLDSAISREVISRKEGDATLSAAVQEARLSQQTLEYRLKEQLSAAASSNAGRLGVPASLDTTRAESCERGLLEVKENCRMLNTSFEQKLEEVFRKCKELVQAEQRRCEEALCAHESVVQSMVTDKLGETVFSVVDSVVQRGAQGLLTTRQDVLDLRTEFSDQLRAESKERERAVADALKVMQQSQVERPTEQGVKPDLLPLVDQQANRQRVLESELERLGANQQDVHAELAQLRANGQAEGAARRKEVSELCQEVVRLRDQLGAKLAAHSGGGPAKPFEVSDAARCREVRQQVVALMESEMPRKIEQKITAEVRGLLNEHRDLHERGIQSVKVRMDMAEQSIFIDSGKREERDRDIACLIAKVQEELNQVKQRLNLCPVPRGPSRGSSSTSAASARVMSTPGSAVGSAGKLMHVVTP